MALHQGAVFVGNKIENDFCDLIFISHVVWQVLPERSTMVLPLDEVSKYFIPKKNAKNRNVLKSDSYLPQCVSSKLYGICCPPSTPHTSGILENNHKTYETRVFLTSQQTCSHTHNTHDSTHTHHTKTPFTTNNDVTSLPRICLSLGMNTGPRPQNKQIIIT